MAVVWFRLRAVGRQRWRAWLALALLVGLGGGIVLGALAGARRTDSAYGRFLKEVNAFDVALAGVDLEAVRRLPQVADVAGNDFLLMEKEGDDRRFDLSPLLPAGDGMYERINGLKVLKGRRPDPSRADEVSISRIGAETYGLGVGDVVVMKAFAPDQLEAVLGGEPPSPAGPRFMFRVVGIDATPTEFLPTSPNPATIHLTPAFGRTHGHEVAAIPGLAIKLKAGGADVDPFKREVERITGEAGVQFITGGLTTSREAIENETLPAFLFYYDRYPGYGFWAAIERSTGDFLGWFHFRPGDGHSDDEPELGYRLRRSAWGKGIATEGCRALIDKGFAEHGVQRVLAETLVVHTASRRVMEKSGLRLIRVFHADWPYRIPGDEHGDVEYALTRAEWEGQAR